MPKSVKVSVIGAGVCGLVAARELQREGHQVVVYEKAEKLGGTWAYDPRIDSDPLGVDPNRTVINTSLYKSVRTNTPRQVMCFSDYPFCVVEGGDSRDFPCHEEVLRFIQSFAVDFGLVGLVRFGEEVVGVEAVVDDVNGGRKWVVESKNGGTAPSSRKEEFEAVVVCVGRWTEPQVAKFPGYEKWRGYQLHSHNYRVPQPFQGQVVVIIGAGPSAFDISREVSMVAEEVHLSSRSSDVQVTRLTNFSNIWQHSKIVGANENGIVTFEDGCSIKANIIIHCTGYTYGFPFMKTNGMVTVDTNRVGPLYKHVFSPKLAPSLSFIGIPQRGLYFPMAELQSKWIANVLSGKMCLPSEENMLANVEEFYKEMTEQGIPIQNTHILNPIEYDYVDWLSEQLGMEPIDDDMKDIYRRLCAYRLVANEGFRDKFQVGAKR